MANIHVEPKKPSTNSSLVWIVLVLLLAAALVYYLVTRNNDTNTTTVPVNTTGAVSLPQWITGNTTLYLC